MQSSRKSKIVRSVSVGNPPKTMGKKTETIEFIIHDFKNREEGPETAIISSVADAHGYKWNIHVYPRDFDRKSSVYQEYVSCYLRMSTPILRGVTAHVIMRCEDIEYSAKRTFDYRLMGWKISVPRDYALENCVKDDGSLVFQCDIRIAVEDRRVWYPPGIPATNTYD